MPKVKIEELPECPVEVTLKMISSRWAVLILRDLFNGSKRNSELLQSLHGISQKVLTSNLRDMENNGLISRKVYPEVPPRVEYSLTPCGESLKPVLDAMMAWGNQYKTSLTTVTQQEDAQNCTADTAVASNVQRTSRETSAVQIKE